MIERKHIKKALFVTAVYCLMGFLWIILSDKFFLNLTEDPQLITSYQTAKGWFFVGISGLFIYFLAMRYYRKREELTNNKNYLSHIYNSVNEAIFIVDAESKRFIDINNKTCSLFGYNREEILKSGIADLTAESSVYNETYAHEILNSTRNKQPLIMEWKVKHKDGHDFWVDVNVNHGYLEDQEIFFVTIRDIDDRKKAQKDLSNIFTLSSELICIVNMDNLQFKRINPAFSKLLGFAEQEILDKRLVDFIPPEEKDEITRFLENKIENEVDVINFETRFLCAVGNNKWLNWVMHPVKEEGYVYALARDVTERKQAEVELLKYRENLENLVEERTHELEIKNKELEEKNDELEHFNQLFIGREFRINELKNEIVRLKQQFKGEK
ncbi:MAG: PAS domain S-box protein [Bacteroidales bacterium]|nr:PAS domain S-box protein [Bacteroidales bacterium]